MNFLADLESISTAVLDHYGVDYSSASNSREIVRMFVNVQLKLIKPIPRTVKISKVLKGKTLDESTERILEVIEAKITRCDDINPHLSKWIFKGTFTDLLFADWNMYHLHLNTVVDGPYFIKRSKDVLFMKLFDNTAYFIDIRPHGRNGEKHVFAQKDLLQTVCDEWPYLLEPYHMKGLAGSGRNFDKPEEINSLRKNGVNTLQEINDKVYEPMGGGITTAGTATNVTTNTDMLYQNARRAEEYLKENKDCIEEQLRKLPGYKANSSKFKYILGDVGFAIFEENTSSVLEV